MKALGLKIISLLAGVSFLNFFVPITDANETLNMILNKLNIIDEISYDFNLSINYFSEDYQRNFSTYTYLSFSKNDSILGFQFQGGNSDYMSVYDGKKYFYVDKNKGTIKLNEKPDKNTFRSSTFLVNSISTLKYFLPTLIATEKIPKVRADTIIDGVSLRMVSFTLKNEMLNRFGELQKLDLEKDITYTIVIDANNVPLQVIQRDNKNPKDFMSVTFKNTIINGIKPDPKSWKHESYLDKYKSIPN